MAQTYAEFKSWVANYLWRSHDTELNNNLDKIIRMADAELNRKLLLQRREVSITIAPETEDYSLPDDFYQMVSVTNKQPNRQPFIGNMKSTTKQFIEEQRAATNSAYIMPYYYPQRGESANTLYLVGPFSATNPGSFDLTYRTAIPDYQTTDASWVEEDYLDLYTFMALKHAAMFSREEERVQAYALLAEEALASAITEDNHEVKFGGAPLHMPSVRPIPQTRRR